jgi:hypothetical protein
VSGWMDVWVDGSIAEWIGETVKNKNKIKNLNKIK